MLELAMKPSDPKAAEIVTRHVNNRLLQVMREKIYDYAVYEKAMDEKIKKIKVDPATHLPKLPHISKLDEVVDFGELMEDEGFAENVSLPCLPKSYRSLPARDANRPFISLYKLLKAKGEYTPELPMQYILYQLICVTAEMLSDMEDTAFLDEDEDPPAIERIPEPDRSYVLDKTLEESDAPADDIMRYYEDFREYDETCFEDVDFAMLSYVDEKTLRSTPVAEYIGLQDEQGKHEMDLTIGGKNIHAELKIAPWEMESE